MDVDGAHGDGPNGMDAAGANGQGTSMDCPRGVGTRGANADWRGAWGANAGAEGMNGATCGASMGIDGGLDGVRGKVNSTDEYCKQPGVKH